MELQAIGRVVSPLADLVHPRDDAARARTGVFSTRSPDRPNPIGLYRVRVLGGVGGR